MATSSRTIWKGAISFGLVHIPVGLHGAATEDGIDFDWLDKRSMDPVGYKRVNKKTGKEIAKEHIVKGFEYEDGHYVVISPEEIAAAYPRTTQTIEIQRFIDASELPFVYLDRPYYLAPISKGSKPYALLRETLVQTGKIGLAKVVIQTKQHLAALVPSGKVLVLNLLRWGDEVKGLDGLELPAEGVKGANLGAAELKMAAQLVKEMSGKWKPQDFKDEFKQSVMQLVHKKVKAGKTETVIQPEEDAPSESSNVVDLTELLSRSLKGGRKAVPPKSASPKSPAARSPAKAAGKAAGKAGAKTARPPAGRTAASRPVSPARKRA